ncbi:alpha-1,2-mannosidase, putative [Actinacidiphila yanglinensis]|uniref:Alpha-1,2-mannosidase, putative n=1 Tax=Actinacidiphila yanglinensis TaxID=310779 RepID=A0A1H6AFZ9_9ACTN|nr:GH92 family glycosyl hydrolase [Actinacidiphila yanglinensis]SEG46686.1 alpha-1,2-mannosidase, putative [Actinacidiphila yanglinensis]
MALHAGRSWRVGVAGLALAAFGVGGLTAPPALAAPSARAATSDPASLVDEFIGTQDNHAANTTESAYGDTTPGATTPFGMVDFNPTTYNTAGGSYTNQGGYEYDADQIRGFSLNRISGTGCAGTNGAEDFPVFPYAGALPGGVLPTVPSASGIKSYYSSFDHAQESATPGSYQVTLGNGIKSELTATTRTGDARFTFPASAASGTLVFDTAGSLNGSSHATVRILGNDVIEGSTTVQPTCKVGPSYTAYFYARFTTPFTAAGTWQDSAESAVVDLGASTDVSASSNAAHGTGAFVSFAPGSTTVADIGLSYVSADGARANLDSEVGHTGFDALRASAHRTWDSTLGQIRVGGGKPTGTARSAQLETFYTALYHATLHPNVFDDADGQYTGYDGKLHAVKPGHHEYTTYSGWDIYRDEAQLIALLFPDRASDMNQSITDLATQAGWFNWPMLDSAQNKMDGDSLDSVLASMDAFGATDYDRAGALRSMVDSQTLVPNDAPNAPAGGVPVTNRRQGFYQYAALGFDSDTNGIAWPTSSDLEYTVDDFGIAQMAQRLGDDSAYGTFMQRAQGWQNLFDTGQDALAPRNKNGFDRGVNLKVNTGQFAEASGAQYGWMVPQNIAGLVAKKGGAAQVEAQLDAFFSNLAPGSTQANPGSNSPYAYMSNEIDSQDPELYNWIGRPDRTADVNQEIRDALWTDNDPDGLFGNDDLGALSAWYVWSSIGVFPAVYGRSELVVSGPAFSSVKITSSGPSHRTYTLNAPGQSDSSRYVTGMRVDGRAGSASWLPQSFAQKGGTVDFTMSDHPGSWGTGKDDVPPSFSDGSDAYNNIGATPSGEGDTGSFDASNNSYQAGLLPAPGATVALPGTSVTYTWPDTAAGAPDNWIPHGQTIAMGGVRAGQISFLGAATNGPSAGMASVDYTDGTHQDVPVDLNDWTSPNLPSGANTTVLTTAHRDNANGTQDNTPAMVYGTSPQKLDPWKTIASVTLPTATDNGVMHVFAIGTSPADAAPLQASAVLPDHSGRQVNADLVTLSGGAGGGAADYRVSVEWGDGHSGTATVLALGASGDYSAFGSHAYRSPGRYRVTVKVSDGTSTRTVTTSLAVS